MSARHVLAFLVILSGAVVSAAAQQPAPNAPSAANPAAQGATASKPAPPPADPFVRGQGGPKPALASSPDRAITPMNLLTTLETWSMSRADFVALLDGPANQDATYARIEELAAAGKAKLIGLTAITTKSGQRAVVESIDEFRYASEFQPAQHPGEIVSPTEWQTRNTGDTLEIEPTLGPDGKTISVNVAPKIVRFGGYFEWRAEAGELVAYPKFHTEGVSTSLTVQSGRPTFLSTATPALEHTVPQPSTEVRLLVLCVSAQVAPPPPATAATAHQGRIDVLFYEMDRTAAREVLRNGADSAKSHAAVRELVARGDGKIELATAFVTKFGSRVVNDENTEEAFPVPRKGPLVASEKSQETQVPASAVSYEVRNVGVMIECEPLIDSEGRFVNLNIVPQVVSYNGKRKVEGVAAKYPEQPAFTTQKITTTATTAIGIPVLLGAMNRPGGTAVEDQKDGGRTTLVYVRVTPVTP